MHGSKQGQLFKTYEVISQRVVKISVILYAKTYNFLSKNCKELTFLFKTNDVVA